MQKIIRQIEESFDDRINKYIIYTSFPKPFSIDGKIGYIVHKISTKDKAMTTYLELCRKRINIKVEGKKISISPYFRVKFGYPYPLTREEWDSIDPSTGLITNKELSDRRCGYTNYSEAVKIFYESVREGDRGELFTKFKKFLLEWNYISTKCWNQLRKYHYVRVMNKYIIEYKKQNKNCIVDGRKSVLCYTLGNIRLLSKKTLEDIIGKRLNKKNWKKIKRGNQRNGDIIFLLESFTV